MNKSELVERVSKKANLSVKDSNAAVNAFMSVVKESLANGEEVVLVGFGSFLDQSQLLRFQPSVLARP